MARTLQILLLLCSISSSSTRLYAKASPWPVPVANPIPSALAIPRIEGSEVVALPGPPESFHLPHTYMVQFRPESSKKVREEHISWIKSLESKDWQIEEHERLVKQQRRYPHSEDEWRATSPDRGLVVLRHVFELVYQGYSAVIMDENTLDSIRRKPEVWKLDRVGITNPRDLPTWREKDASIIRPPAIMLADQTPADLDEMNSRLVSGQLDPITSPSASIVQNRGWNTVRISHRNFTKGYSAGPWVRDRNLGKGVTVYVLDTGINLLQPGFKGSKVTFGKNFVGWRLGRNVGEGDAHGHGTMCAGVIAGDKHGISPEAHTVAVKIADDNNRSACDDVVAGIEWVTSQPGTNNMKVISMSHYGFTGKPDVATAVSKAVANGIHYVVCSGNDGRDACNIQPSTARGVISVGSVNAFNKFPIKGAVDTVGGMNGIEPEGTNTGSCVTIFGPGSKVPSLTTKNLDPNYRYWSWGTSIAAPQVAAVIANRLSAVGPQTPAQMKSWLTSVATKGQIEEKDLKGSPNLILYTGISE